MIKKNLGKTATGIINDITKAYIRYLHVSQVIQKLPKGSYHFFNIPNSHWYRIRKKSFTKTITLCNGIIYPKCLKENHPKLYKFLNSKNLMTNIETSEKMIEYSYLPLLKELMTHKSIPESLSFKGNDFGILKLYEKL